MEERTFRLANLRQFTVPIVITCSDKELEGKIKKLKDEGYLPVDEPIHRDGAYHLQVKFQSKSEDLGKWGLRQIVGVHTPTAGFRTSLW